MTQISYGQVYRCLAQEVGPHGFIAWRGVLWSYLDGEGREAWASPPLPTPDSAFDSMVLEAKRHDISDLRRWSGVTPPIVEQNHEP